MVGDKLCNLFGLYKFPSQSQDQFESSNENRQQNLEPAAQNNPFIVAVPYHLNVKVSDWCKNDIPNHN